MRYWSIRDEDGNQSTIYDQEFTNQVFQLVLPQHMANNRYIQLPDPSHISRPEHSLSGSVPASTGAHIPSGYPVLA